MRFRIDPRLEADGIPLVELPLCHVLLTRDARFPWMVAVPRVAGAEELADLAPGNRAGLVEELALLANALKAETRAHKVNVAALGNIVRQLHFHVVARFEGDAAWPGPVRAAAPPSLIRSERLMLWRGGYEIVCPGKEPRSRTGSTPL